MANTYVSFSQYGPCKICEYNNDLRCGVCFKCSHQVNGHKISEHTYELCDVLNPSNKWVYSTIGN
jgi:hypothetical protein